MDSLNCLLYGICIKYVSLKKLYHILLQVFPVDFLIGAGMSLRGASVGRISLSVPPSQSCISHHHPPTFPASNLAGQQIVDLGVLPASGMLVILHPGLYYIICIGIYDLGTTTLYRDDVFGFLVVVAIPASIPCLGRTAVEDIHPLIFRIAQNTV